ncbi:Hypothetical protein A7982_06385 [Minicystis rosea]|nr:Hypothetical protein A7982_06385 [Minicystis rosea]
MPPEELDTLELTDDEDALDDATLDELVEAPAPPAPPFPMTDTEESQAASRPTAESAKEIRRQHARVTGARQRKAAIHLSTIGERASRRRRR